MPDVVKRLRDLQTVFTGATFSKAYHRLGDEMGAAADEIDRLRKTLREIEDSSNDPRAVREARAALEKT